MTHRGSESDREEPVLRWLRLIKRIVTLSMAVVLIGGTTVVLTALYLRSQALPASKAALTTKIYDMHGDPIDAFPSGQNRENVPLSQISPWLVKATLAIEDHRFYEHPGIDPKGMARAVVTDIKTLSMEQGASTVTQQLARNLYLSHERTWSRKFKEAMYALQLELQLSKDQILEKYLNQIYYGHGTYGIQAAARMYFNKDAKDLDLAESALVAGVPKGPKYYSPYLDMENAKQRQKNILDAMARYNEITPEAAKAAFLQELHIIPLQANRPAEAPYFRDYVLNAAIDKLGINEKLHYAGGIRIYTTLDLAVQRVAEEAVAKQADKTGELQAALIAIDPRTGYIKAMVGGKDYASNQFNRVFANTRQPGSSFKPIVYLTALENRFTPLTKYKDEPTEFLYDDGKKVYKPSNYNNQYTREEIDLRRAIAQSDNIYAVHTLVDVGSDKVIEMARKMGITSNLLPLPSLALGTFPVSPYEMAGAFAILANGGVRAEPTTIVKIEDDSGRTLYQAKPKETKVVDPALAYVLTNLMESVFEEGGTGFRVSDLMKRPVAGKTGTTDSDAWMVGFTPELATAVWVGYDRSHPITSVEAHKAAPIFADFTERALESVPPKLFPVPEGVVTVHIDTATGKLSNSACPQSRVEVFVKGTEPTEYCTGAASSAPPKEPDNGIKMWWKDLKRWWNE